MKRICVFCGSSPGKGDTFIKSTKSLAMVLINHDIELIYGGAKVGTMGVLANTFLAHKKKVIGIMPKALVDREVAHNGIDNLYVVDSMHERKAMMEKESDAFIAMPGGLGTVEELLEMWTWGQLGIHNKPVALYNVNGFFDKLLEFMDVLVNNNFMEETYKNMVIVSDDPHILLEKIRLYDHPKLDKAIEALKKHNGLS